MPRVLPERLAVPFPTGRSSLVERVHPTAAMPEPQTKPPRINWAEAPLCFVVLPSCQHCRSTRYRSSRSVDNGDGSRTLLAVCRDCGEPYKIISEHDST